MRLRGGTAWAPSHQREDWSNEKNLRFVGLDVHKDTISIAVAESGREPARLLETIPADEWLLLKVLDRLGPKSRLRVCYEAGPTGYGLARQLNEQGICCVVVAPSLVPTQKNRRIKTDRRDAVRLAHFLRSGDLVEVSIPEAQTEAMRDLERAREDAIQMERVARQQLDKFLLRHGRRWSAGGKWTRKHWKWIKVQEFPEEASRRVLRRLHPDGGAGVGTGPTLNRGHQRTGRALDFGAFSPCAASAAGRGPGDGRGAGRRDRRLPALPAPPSS